MNWKQFISLIKLRFQLSRNQIRKKGDLNTILYVIVMIVFVSMILSSFFFGVAVGVPVLQSMDADGILLAWNIIVLGFSVLWMFALMNSIQQTEMISIDKLLHLPISFQGAFVLNYISSFMNLTLLMSAPLMIGLSIAMPIARGWPSAVTIPLNLSFLFMLTAITYQFRGWLAEKLKNKRTRGFLMAIIPLSMVAVFVITTKVTDSNLLKNVLGSVALGWLPSGAVAAESGNWMTGVLGSLAMTAIGAASLYFAFRASMRKYTGTDSVGRQKSTATLAVDWNKSSLFNSLPFMSGPVSTYALCSLRSLKRSPEMIAAIIPAIVMFVFGAPYLMGMEGYDIDESFKLLIPMIVIFVTLIGFPAFLFTTFSYERDGFRGLILAPLNRSDTLLGRNLGIAIPSLISGWVLLSVLQILIPIGWFWFLGGLIQVAIGYVLLCILGNAISIFFPMGLKRGSMTPVKPSILSLVVLYTGVLIGPAVALIPMQVVFGISYFAQQGTGVQMGWLYVLLSFGLLAGSWLLYRWSLSGLGQQLWNRESEILDIVANIPE